MSSFAQSRCKSTFFTKLAKFFLPCEINDVILQPQTGRKLFAERKRISPYSDCMNLAVQKNNHWNKGMIGVSFGLYSYIFDDTSMWSQSRNFILDYWEAKPTCRK